MMYNRANPQCCTDNVGRSVHFRRHQMPDVRLDPFRVFNLPTRGMNWKLKKGVTKESIFIKFD